MDETRKGADSNLPSTWPTWEDLRKAAGCGKLHPNGDVDKELTWGWPPKIPEGVGRAALSPTENVVPPTELDLVHSDYAAGALGNLEITYPDSLVAGQQAQ
ncbi:MAG TPA: hypothetical protein VGS08_04955 [Candidatus Saccharimonadales bacterium]|nr:hypothetical protein [Candidatus Saccharimonadales bacterium]